MPGSNGCQEPHNLELKTTQRQDPGGLETVWKVKMLTTLSDDQSLIHRTHVRKERRGSHKLPSDFYMCAVTCTLPHTYTHKDTSTKYIFLVVVEMEFHYVASLDGTPCLDQAGLKLCWC